MIHVIATIRTVPGKRADLIAAFRELTPKVHAEQGCVEYGAAVDIATPIAAQEPPRDDVLVMVEKWDSVAALEAHLAAPHMEAFRAANGQLIEDISLQILQPA